MPKQAGDEAALLALAAAAEKVDYVIHLGKRARRVVRQNVWFSVGWMLLLVVVTLTVGMPLTLAVVAHEGSTLLVAANGLRLLGGRPHPPVVPQPRTPAGPAESPPLRAHAAAR